MPAKIRMKNLKIQTKGNTDIIDITKKVQDLINKENFKKGLIHLFVIGSTCSLTTCEDDPNLYKDLKEMFEKIAPYKKDYHHHQTWGDDNGASHLRASLLKQSLTVPVTNSRLFLGTWQKIILIDFDTKPRTREVLVNFIKA